MILVPYKRPLDVGRFRLRYKRFLVDVIRPDGRVEAVHCANSGSMRSCTEPDCEAWTLDSENPKRKLRHSLELLRLTDGLACLNTGRANEIIEQVFRKYENMPWQLLRDDVAGCNVVEREVRYDAGTRFDLRLRDMAQSRQTWIEVKSVSLLLDNGRVAFPDAVTTRGQKHLRVLGEVAERGDEAMMVFCIMRGANSDARELAQGFAPAVEIDPEYARLLYKAMKAGVKVRVAVSEVSVSGLGIRYYGEPSI